MTYKQVSLRSRGIKTNPVHTDQKQVTTDPSPAKCYELARATRSQFAEISSVMVLILS